MPNVFDPPSMRPRSLFRPAAMSFRFGLEAAGGVAASLRSSPTCAAGLPSFTSKRGRGTSAGICPSPVQRLPDCRPTWRAAPRSGHFAALQSLTITACLISEFDIVGNDFSRASDANKSLSSWTTVSYSFSAASDSRQFMRSGRSSVPDGRPCSR